VLRNLDFYAKVIWPINMLILGVASIGIFIEKERWKNILRNILFLLVLVLPIALPFFKHQHYFMTVLNISYVVFFSFIFFEIIKFLIRPGYINADIISAAACGYLLLLEISVFLMQFFFYSDAASFKGIDPSSPSTVFTDLVYFCSITLTSIGFGDITPGTHYTKLATSLFGIAGQFYSVVLVGILISKFSSTTEKK
jgi:Ion channel